MTDTLPHLDQLQDVLGDRLQGWRIVPILNWLAGVGRHLADANELTRQLALEMVSANAPIVRLRLSVRTHDENRPGWSAVWQLGRPLDRDRLARPGFLATDSYRGSPLSVVDQTQQPYRMRLDRGAVDDAHQTLRDLAAQGATDYLALPLRLDSLPLATIVLVTDRLDGFTSEDLKKFAVLVAAVAPVFEAVILRHLLPESSVHA